MIPMFPLALGRRKGREKRKLMIQMFHLIAGRRRGKDQAENQSPGGVKVRSRRGKVAQMNRLNCLM